MLAVVLVGAAMDTVLGIEVITHRMGWECVATFIADNSCYDGVGVEVGFIPHRVCAVPSEDEKQDEGDKDDEDEFSHWCSVIVIFVFLV